MKNSIDGLGRLERLLAILNYIDRGAMEDGEEITPPRLARAFSVSERTIFRDLSLLSFRFPIYFDRDKNRYLFVWGYSLKQSQLTPEEIRTMLLSRTILEKLGDPFEKALDAALRKLNAAAKGGAPESAWVSNRAPHYWINLSPISDFSSIQAQYVALERALAALSTVEFEYRGMRAQEESSRTVNPYGLAFHNGMWYLVGYCHSKKAVRVFALDCMSNVRITDRYFLYPASFNLKDYFKKGWRFAVVEGAPVEVVLKFGPEVARYIKRRKWHPTQKIEERPSGEVLLKVKVAGTQEILNWALGWGASCKVLSPPALVSQMKDLLDRTRAVYG